MDQPSKCPTCLKAPGVWYESAKFHSHEVVWVGCQPCGHLTGGYSFNIAFQCWERMVHRLRYDGNRKETHYEES